MNLSGIELTKKFNKILLIHFFLLIIPQFSFPQDSTFIKSHLNYLGSDLFQGRGTGTIGGELAAKYIALYLNKYELLPMGYENTFYQYIPMHGTKPKDDSEIIIINKNHSSLKIKKDFQFFHIDGRIFAPNPIPMVFVGYGISAHEFGYDDYANVDVEGKVVLYLEGEPISENSEFFNGMLPTNYSFADTKQKIALSKGAVGTIQIPSFSCRSEADWEKISQEFYFEDITLAYLPTPLLSILLNPKSASIIFNNSLYSFDSIMEMSKTQNLKSFELQTQLILKPKSVRRDFVSSNVVGFISGNDQELRNEYIVISAHYDHLGIGLPVMADSIYNGVLDNAIGVSALLELAKIISENSASFKRSVIFLFVTGEEKGLLGSSYFIENPPIPINNIVANINVDGLAVIDVFNSIVGVGAEFSSLNNSLHKVAASNNLRVDKIPSEFDSFESFLHSDQLAFALAGIPSILISDGIDYVNYSREEALHKWQYYINKKYHTPFDDLNQSINYKAVNKHIKILYDFILEVANNKSKIEWNSMAPFKRNEK
jgi:Peptidase family M28